MAALPPDQFPPPFLSQTQGGVTLPSGQRSVVTEGMTQVPAFSQQSIDLSNTLKQNFEALSSLSSQISRNLGGDLESSLLNNARHIDSMARNTQRLNQFSQERAQQERSITQFAKQRAEAEERITAAAAEGNDKLRMQFDLAGMLTRQGRITYVGPGDQPAEMSMEEFLTPAEQLTAQQADLRNSIRQQLINRAALEQPYSGFSVTETLQHLMHGNIGAALGELMQGTPRLRGVTQGIAQYGRGIQEGAAPGAAGFLSRGFGSLLESGAGFLTSPAFGFILQREIRNGIRDYQENLRTGMQTGLQGTEAVRESIGAGLRARIEGINPFDALTTQMATQIARGIESEGFAGSIRAAWQDSVTDVVKSTGMDAGQALQLMQTSANQLGETARQFRQDMALVEQTAKDTNVSVQQAAQTLQQFQTALVARGGVAAAAPAAQLAQNLITALPRAVTQRGTLSQAILQNWQVIAARAGGVNPLQAFLPSTLQQANRILDQLGTMLWNIKNQNPAYRRMDLNTWVVMMSAAGLFDQFLPGTTVQDIVQFMTATRGGGLEQHAEQNLAQQARAATQPVQHHRGLFGSILHGAAHIATEAVHGAGDVIGYGAEHSLTTLGVPRNEARRLAQIFGDTEGTLTQLNRVPVYNDRNLAAMRQEQINFWKRQTEDLSTQQQNQILAPVRAAQNESQLNAAATQAQTIYIKLHPSAQKYFNAEPNQVQRYYDQARGQSSTQGMIRPVK